MLSNRVAGDGRSPPPVQAALACPKTWGRAFARPQPPFAGLLRFIAERHDTLRSGFAGDGIRVVFGGHS
mgnify:CR=1 FL=1